MIEIGRRGLIAGIGALFAAPAIVKAASLMPVKVMRPSISIRALTDYAPAAFEQVRGIVTLGGLVLLAAFLLHTRIGIGILFVGVIAAAAWHVLRL